MFCFFLGGLRLGLEAWFRGERSPRFDGGVNQGDPTTHPPTTNTSLLLNKTHFYFFSRRVLQTTTQQQGRADLPGPTHVRLVRVSLFRYIVYHRTSPLQNYDMVPYLVVEQTDIGRPQLYLAANPSDDRHDDGRGPPFSSFVRGRA